MERASPMMNLGFVEPWTRDMFALGFVKPTELCCDLLRTCLGSTSVELGFDKSYVQHKCCDFAYMTLTVSGLYQRRGGVNQWDLTRTDLGFCKPFRGLTRELSDLGFEHRALGYMSLVVGGMHQRCGDMLLQICHSLWVTHTGVMMVIHSYMYVTCHG